MCSFASIHILAHFGIDIILNNQCYTLHLHTGVRRLEERQPVDGPWQQGAVVAFMEHVNKVNL